MSRVDAGTLPLVLLAAVGHPDRGVRGRVADRLDAAIVAAGPLHAEEKVRRFLARQAGTDRSPVYLNSAALEVAVRLVRLFFARLTRKPQKKRVRIVGWEGPGDEVGLIIDHRLRAGAPDAQPVGRRRPARAADCRLVVGVVASLLEQLGRREPHVRATCSAGRGFRLCVEGVLPWSAGPIDLGALPAGSPEDLKEQGFRVEFKPGVVRFVPETPEAIIRFSGMLCRGEGIVFRCTREAAPGRRAASCPGRRN
jgi:hypothetical protein